MWLDRPGRKQDFINIINSLSRQVVVVQGARQVGKTAFILHVLENYFKDHPRILVNCLLPSAHSIEGQNYFGRDFFGSNPEGMECIENLKIQLGPFEKLLKPALVFVDEVDRYPLVMEAIQYLATFSKNIRFIFTGSNLQHIHVANAATGRKVFFDLYPITFPEFLLAKNETILLNYLNEISLETKIPQYIHNQALSLQKIYMRLGGLPRILSQYIEFPDDRKALIQITKDLCISIEENIKSILGEKAKLYEYEDVLRKLLLASVNTLKISRLQVQHVNRAEAKKIISKTCGARVIHKMRLYQNETDLSKYILFDSGMAHYLLCGTAIFEQEIPDEYRGILYETFVGQELVASSASRDDIEYWKSENKAEIDFLIKSPILAGIDVKAGSATNKSLNSFALFNKQAKALVCVSSGELAYEKKYQAKLPNFGHAREIPWMNIPHYLTFKLLDLLSLKTV